MILNGKEFKVVMTSGFNAKYGGIEGLVYVSIVKDALVKYPVDMMVFEMKGNDRLQVRAAGYYMFGEKKEELDEETIVFKSKSLPIETFWFKVDEMEDCYLGTFLFPEEW